MTIDISPNKPFDFYDLSAIKDILDELSTVIGSTTIFVPSRATIVIEIAKALKFSLKDFDELDDILDKLRKRPSRGMTPYSNISTRNAETANCVTSVKNAIMTKGDCENILTELTNVVNTRGYIDNMQLCDLAGIPSKDIDALYGWTNLDGFEIKLAFPGHILVVPVPHLLTKG